ncbi:MAG: DUF4349 domain-containing protein [Planctomycetes bacterium]|nr:DUF4349 domain-containing protein [Planctomycetota bacterium]
MSTGYWSWMLVGLVSCTSMLGAQSEAGFAAPSEFAPNSPAPTPGTSLGFATRDAETEVQAEQPNVPRQVIYSASLRLAVVKIADSLSAVHALAREVGGHMQQSESRSITIRVPSAQFEATLARIATLGEVVERSVRANDVTEEMFDIELRLDNLRKARERLLVHLAKSDKLEDTLKIEAELTRVSGEIESLEGRLRFMTSQVSMSTIHVEFNASVPQDATSTAMLGMPFDWIGRLGDGLVAGTVETRPRKPGFFASGPEFVPPADFIRYYSDKSLVEALNADGVRIKVQRHDNYDEGSLQFWSSLTRRALVAGRALAIQREERLDGQRMLLSGSRDIGGRVLGYMLVLLRTDDDVYTFEAWGPAGEFSPREKALLDSARSLER